MNIFEIMAVADFVGIIMIFGSFVKKEIYLSNIQSILESKFSEEDEKRKEG